jgi:DNA-binding Lrp family transcriptional regulator
MALNWEHLTRAEIAAIGLEILHALQAGEASPSQLAKRLHQPLPNLSYRVRRLHDTGRIELVRTEPRRGALEHFYALADDVQTAT